MVTLILTAAQQSALECAGLDIEPTDDERVLIAAWDGRKSLVITDATRDAILMAVIERANAEDGQAIEQHDRHARGASIALTNLSSKIVRL